MRKIRADLTAYGRGRRSKHISSIFVTYSGEAVVIRVPIPWYFAGVSNSLVKFYNDIIDLECLLLVG